MTTDTNDTIPREWSTREITIRNRNVKMPFLIDWQNELRRAILNNH